jgi:hypothetical protein
LTRYFAETKFQLGGQIEVWKGVKRGSGGDSPPPLPHSKLRPWSASFLMKAAQKPNKYDLINSNVVKHFHIIISRFYIIFLDTKVMLSFW